MTFQQFVMRPEVLFCFGLVALVAVIGLLLAKVRLNGRIILAISMLFFGIIIAVNLVLAQRAVATFPGIEVSNGYVASQSFDKRRQAQQRLGWTLVQDYQRGRMQLAFADLAGQPVAVEDLAVLIGRATESREDVTPVFTWKDGVYQADVPLGDGVWMIKVTARAQDGTLFEQRQEFVVRS